MYYQIYLFWKHFLRNNILRGREPHVFRQQQKQLFFISFIGREKRQRQREGEKEDGEKRRLGERRVKGVRKVWTPAPLWPVITLHALGVRVDEGGRGSLYSAWNSSCLTNPPEPHWDNLYALSSLLVFDSESVPKLFIMFVSDITDLCTHTYACIWTGTLHTLFSIIQKRAESLREMQGFVLQAALEV